MLTARKTLAPRRRSSGTPGASGHAISGALGYRVESGDEAGVVVGVPLAGQPPRPLVLVVRDGDDVRFVSVRRVDSVMRNERRIILRPTEEPS